MPLLASSLRPLVTLLAISSPPGRKIPRASLIARRILTCIRRLLDLVGGPRLREKLLQLMERVRPDCTALSANDYKPNRTIELRQLGLSEIARNFLRESQTRDTDMSALITP
jgi:hypothetical protein